jgi:hypothetical protein
MKNKKLINMAVSTLLVLLVGGFWALIGFTQTITNKDDLSFKGQAVKQAFVLGEPVTIEFEFTNQGKESVQIPSSGVETGGLKLFIASKDSGDYKEYFVGSWGRERGGYVTLEPARSSKLKKATILWNGKPNVSHLNETAAKQVLAGKITTEYAFQLPGIYFIKGRSYVGGDGTPIESEPIKIVVNEPDGIDLEVWNQIKGNKEIAHLLQNGSFDTGEDAKKEQLSAQVEQIFTQFPNSIYSSYLKPNLEKYKANEAKRNEAYKNMKLGQKPE